MFCSRVPNSGPVGAYIFDCMTSARDDVTQRRTLQEAFGDWFDADTLAAVEALVRDTDSAAIEVNLDDRDFEDLDFARTLGSVGCPILPLHGDLANGGQVRDRDLTFFAAHAPDATAVRVAGGSQMFPVEAPEQTVAMMTEWLGSGPSGR